MTEASPFRSWREVRAEMMSTWGPRDFEAYWRELRRLRAMDDRENNPRISASRVLYRRKRRHW